MSLVPETGLTALREGRLTSDAALSALRPYFAVESGRINLRNWRKEHELSSEDAAVKRDVEAAISASTVSWNDFERTVLTAMGNCCYLFGTSQMELLPIVVEFIEKYRLNGKTLREYVREASKLNETTYAPIRELFAQAEPGDRFKFALYLRAHWYAQLRGGNRRCPTMLGHCDKYPAFETLSKEFAAAVASQPDTSS